LLGRYIGVARNRLALHFDDAAHRVDDAGEFDEKAVTGGFDSTTAMLPRCTMGTAESPRALLRPRVQRYSPQQQIMVSGGADENPD